MSADTIRVASFSAELDRKGPGVLLRDIQRNQKQVAAVIAEITRAKPDVLTLQRFDWDLDLLALKAFQTALENAGWPMEHAIAPRPNSGVPTGFDTGDKTQGFGRFPGNRGLVVFSRYAFDNNKIHNDTDRIWQDEKWNPQGQRLHSVALISVPVLIDGKVLTVLTTHASAPVFDNGTGRNAARNAAQISRITALAKSIDGPFVISANLNLAPYDGQGNRSAIADLLADSALTDPMPKSLGAKAAADLSQTGDPALDTADWPEDGPGNLRVSYVLPSRDLNIVDAGVQWDVGQDNTASRHRVVWVDVTFP